MSAADKAPCESCGASWLNHERAHVVGCPTLARLVLILDHAHDVVLDNRQLTAFRAGDISLLKFRSESK